MKIKQTLSSGICSMILAMIFVTLAWGQQPTVQQPTTQQPATLQSPIPQPPTQPTGQRPAVPPQPAVQQPAPQQPGQQPGLRHQQAAPSPTPQPVPRQMTPPAPPQPPSPPAIPASPPARQAGQPGQRNAVQMNFDSIELRDLIRFISTIMGKNFIFDESVVKGKVTILSPKDLTKDEVLRVFESVMNYYGFQVITTPEAMRIVKGADMKGLATEKLDKANLSNEPPSDRPATYVHFLDYLDANTMVGVLRPMMSKDAYIVGIASTNAVILIDAASNIMRIKNVLAEIDVPISKQLGGIRVYNVQHTNAADLGKALQALLAEGKKAQTPKDKIFITSYPQTNALLISAPLEDLKEIERIIADIDTLRPQVLVEAAIVEVSTSKGRTLGVEWLGGVSTGGTTGIAGGFTRTDGSLLGVTAALMKDNAADAAAGVAGALKSGFNVGVIGGSVTFNGTSYPTVGAFVSALATLDNVNILSTPQLLTKDNEEAEIVVGENRPYLTSSRLDVAGTPTYSYDYRDVGVKLKIKPQINKDGFVYLNLYQEVSQVTNSSTGGTNSVPAPTTLKRSTKTTVVVRDSETVVISGLIKDNSTNNEQGIPFLSSIPLIGYLFGYKSKTFEKTNLLVFLTPRIIYSAQSLAEISKKKKEEQDRLIGSQAGGTK